MSKRCFYFLNILKFKGRLCAGKRLENNKAAKVMNLNFRTREFYLITKYGYLTDKENYSKLKVSTINNEYSID